MKQLRIFGLCRSGNHAIIGWLIDKHIDGVTHRNNVIFNKNKKRFVNSEQPRIYHKKLPMNTMITSHEDYNLNTYFSEYEKYHPDVPHTNVFILRDPYNLFASRVKKSQEHNHRRLKINDNIVATWKILVREAYNITNLTDNKVIINFNKWVTSKEYRDSISIQLNLPIDRDNINVMSKDGNGSSFDRYKFKKNPQEMKVLERWKYFGNNAAFMDIFKDKELVELARTYFDIGMLNEDI